MGVCGFALFRCGAGAFQDPEATRSKLDGWVKGLLNRTFGSYTLATLEQLFVPLTWFSFGSCLV